MKGYLIAIIFIIGLGLGIAGMFYAPKYLDKYMPEVGALGAGGGNPVEGKVVAKLPRADKLLITVSTPDGASLVTFNQKVDEIALLVDEGDYITLKIGKYKPFVMNPSIVRVRKEAPEFGGTAPSVIPPEPSTVAPKNEEPAPQTPETVPGKQDQKPEMTKPNPESAAPQPGGGTSAVPPKENETPAGKEGAQEETHTDQSTSIFERYRYVGHAFGGVDGVTYPNSLEAFYEGYQNGRRLFEVDLSMLSDGTVVAFHDGYEKLYGFSKHISKVTHREFLSARIRDKFTPVDLDMLVSLMRTYPDSYIVTDTKGDFHKMIALFVWKARMEDPAIARRIIPQVYNEMDYADAMSIYPFKEIIYTLYRTGADDASVLAFLMVNKNITGLTISKGRFHEALARKAEELGRYVFVHTLNSEEQMRPFANKGAYGFYTDFYYPLTSVASAYTNHSK